MDRRVVANRLAPGRVGDYRDWCGELRRRRAELDGSRRRAGITREAWWLSEEHGVAIVRVEAEDVGAAVDRLTASENAFDAWFTDRARAVLGGDPYAGWRRPPERLADFGRDGADDDLTLFIALAVPLLPGCTPLFRREVLRSVGSGHGAARARSWGLDRLGIWLDTDPAGDGGAPRDLVVYDAVGDLLEALEVIAESTEPDMVAQRGFVRDVFGIDLRVESLPLPVPTFAWSRPVG